jgi:hypothetical protein
LKNIIVGAVYAYDIDCNTGIEHAGTYTVEVLSLNQKRTGGSMFAFMGLSEDGSSYIPVAKCRSLQTAEEFECNLDHLTDLETCNKLLASYKNFECTGEDKKSLNKKIKRLENTLNVDTSEYYMNLAKYKPLISKEEIKQLDNVIRFCVDNNLISYCKQFSNLKKKLDYYVSEM